MKIKLEQGEYTEAELLQKIEEAKKIDWKQEYNDKFSFEAISQHDDIIHKHKMLFTDMFRFAILRNDGWVADWNNLVQEKFGINECNDIVCYFKYNAFRYGISVKSEEIAEEMLEIFGERIKEIYGKQ